MIKIKYLFFLIFLIPVSSVYAVITIENADFEFQDFALNVTTPVTVDSFEMNGTGFTTNSGEDLRYYQFGNHTLFFNVRWINQTSTYANFTITTPATVNVIGNVTGTELGSVEIDQVSVPWTFTTLNIVDIDNGILVEYFFPEPPTPVFNAIVLSINSPALDRLGGVFAILCPVNSTLTGLLTNGTFVCTDMSEFFP